MKTIVTGIAFFFLLIPCIAQKIHVVDASTKRPIENATITSVINNHLQLLGFSDIDGNFVIPKSITEGFLLVSNMSFKTDTILIRNITGNLKLELKPLPGMLEDIAISTHQWKNETNIIPAGKKLSHYVSSNVYGIVGSIINIEQSNIPFAIKEISFFMPRLRKTECKQGIILYILKCVEDKPTMEYIYEPVVLPATNLRGSNTIDISKYISTPAINEANIFIGFQWQEPECNVSSILSKPQFFLRTTSSGADNLWFYIFKEAKWKTFAHISNRQGDISLKIKY
jgi:hypothetical protein